MVVDVIPAPLDVSPRQGAFAGGAGSVHREDVARDALRGPDGYVLSVAPDGIRLQAATEAGFLCGTQTLDQLVPVEGGPIPAVRIEDAPRFAWRGLHLDVVRHMFPLADLKRFVETMARFKLNRLHLHLTDDQGWRLEITSHPKLTEIGAWRTESPRRGAREEGDGVRYGGFYTQAEMRELVAHAAALGITVVPEIDMPGHVQAALAAYPELGHGDAPEVWTRWGISERIFNVSDATFRLIDDVLDEVADVFPSAWIHIGGDEAPTTEWEASPEAQDRIVEQGLADTRALHGWFLSRAAERVARHGRRAVCWDEALEGDVDPDVVVMAWRDAAFARSAATRGHDVVMCPMSHCYFDHYQGPPDEEPEAIGGLTDLDRVLAFDPIDREWSEAERERLLGVQGNLWSEYIHDAAHLEYMAWPRAAALAEVSWSAPESRSTFTARWPVMAARLDALGVNHRRARP